MQKLPPMSAVRVFEAASRLQSFTRAAEELGMTQAAVSYQIKMLEDRLGGPLFVRLPRQVALTETGRRLAPAISEAFDLMRSAFRAVSDAEDQVLSITVLPLFAANWLVPRLGAFQLAHPGWAVRLDSSRAIVDLTRGDFDVGIRNSLGDRPGLEAHKLFSASFVPLCSPQLIERAGPLREPADLLKLPLLNPRDPWWAHWFAAAGLTDVDLSENPDYDFGTQLLDGASALAGNGVAILTPTFFANELATGRLVMPFEILAEDGCSYWLVYPKSRARSAKIRAFRDWLLDEVRTSCIHSAPVKAGAAERSTAPT